MLGWKEVSLLLGSPRQAGAFSENTSSPEVVSMDNCPKDAFWEVRCWKGGL